MDRNFSLTRRYNEGSSRKKSRRRLRFVRRENERRHGQVLRSAQHPPQFYRVFPPSTVIPSLVSLSLQTLAKKEIQFVAGYIDRGTLKDHHLYIRFKKKFRPIKKLTTFRQPTFLFFFYSRVAIFIAFDLLS